MARTSRYVDHSQGPENAVRWPFFTSMIGSPVVNLRLEYETTIEEQFFDSPPEPSKSNARRASLRPSASPSAAPPVAAPRLSTLRPKSRSFSEYDNLWAPRLHVEKEPCSQSPERKAGSIYDLAFPLRKLSRPAQARENAWLARGSTLLPRRKEELDEAWAAESPEDHASDFPPDDEELLRSDSTLVMQAETNKGHRELAGTASRRLRRPEGGMHQEKSLAHDHSHGDIPASPMPRSAGMIPASQSDPAAEPTSEASEPNFRLSCNLLQSSATLPVFPGGSSPLDSSPPPQFNPLNSPPPGSLQRAARRISEAAAIDPFRVSRRNDLSSLEEEGPTSMPMYATVRKAAPKRDQPHKAPPSSPTPPKGVSSDREANRFEGDFLKQAGIALSQDTAKLMATHEQVDDRSLSRMAVSFMEGSTGEPDYDEVRDEGDKPFGSSDDAQGGTSSSSASQTHSPLAFRSSKHGAEWRTYEPDEWLSSRLLRTVCSDRKAECPERAAENRRTIAMSDVTADSDTSSGEAGDPRTLRTALSYLKDSESDADYDEVPDCECDPDYEEVPDDAPPKCPQKVNNSTEEIGTTRSPSKALATYVFPEWKEGVIHRACQTDVPSFLCSEARSVVSAFFEGKGLAGKGCLSPSYKSGGLSVVTLLTEMSKEESLREYDFILLRRKLFESDPTEWFLFSRDGGRLPGPSDQVLIGGVVLRRKSVGVKVKLLLPSVVARKSSVLGPMKRIMGMSA